MSCGFFITGTDTEVGKTTISLGLMQALQQRGLTVAAMKPVSAGCEQTADGLRNEDAVQLMQQASVPLAYELVNPYAFAAAIAPHIAAAEQGVHMEIAPLLTAYREIATQVDVVIVEGAGGWRVPLNETQSLADLAGALELPVINVVGLRLGCLNHALLTEQSILTQGLTSLGWVGNEVVEGMPYLQDNLTYMQSHLQARPLAHIPYQQHSVESIAQRLDVQPLLDSCSA